MKFFTYLESTPCFVLSAVTLSLFSFFPSCFSRGLFAILMSQCMFLSFPLTAANNRISSFFHHFLSSPSAALSTIDSYTGTTILWSSALNITRPQYVTTWYKLYLCWSSNTIHLSRFRISYWYEGDKIWWRWHAFGAINFTGSLSSMEFVSSSEFSLWENHKWWFCWSQLLGDPTEKRCKHANRINNAVEKLSQFN